MPRKLELDSVSAGVNFGFLNVQGNWKAKPGDSGVNDEIRQLKEERRKLQRQLLDAKFSGNRSQQKLLLAKLISVDDKIEKLVEQAEQAKRRRE